VADGNRESAIEVRAIAALVVTGGPVHELVGPCALVSNGAQTVAFSSAELLRRAGEPLAIALTFDNRVTVPVTAWTISRSPAMGLIELGSEFPAGVHDVVPLALAKVNASVETRGAPAALVTVEPDERGWSRRVLPVHVDTLEDDGGDLPQRLASPIAAEDADAAIDGAVLLAWMLADPVLGRSAEVLMTALATPYTNQSHRPRALAPMARLSSLDDLGRALPWRSSGPHFVSNELGQIAGEIKNKT
jgi:hypothetical protein